MWHLDLFSMTRINWQHISWFQKGVCDKMTDCRFCRCVSLWFLCLGFTWLLNSSRNVKTCLLRKTKQNITHLSYYDFDDRILKWKAFLLKTYVLRQVLIRSTLLRAFQSNHNIQYVLIIRKMLSGAVGKMPLINVIFWNSFQAFGMQGRGI